MENTHKHRRTTENGFIATHRRTTKQPTSRTDSGKWNHIRYTNYHHIMMKENGRKNRKREPERESALKKEGGGRTAHKVTFFS